MNLETNICGSVIACIGVALAYGLITCFSEPRLLMNTPDDVIVFTCVSGLIWCLLAGAAIGSVLTLLEWLLSNE